MPLRFLVLLCLALAPLLISSPFAFRRAAAPSRCFSSLLYALPLPRLALRYSALAIPSISIHCLSCSVHFCALATQCYASQCSSAANLRAALLCLRTHSYTLPSPVHALLYDAFAALSFALPLPRFSQLIYALPLQFLAYLRYAYTSRTRILCT